MTVIEYDKIQIEEQTLLEKTQFPIERRRILPDLTLFKDHFVKETLEPGIISCGVAVLPEHREGRLRVASERYLERNYIAPKELNENGLYVDAYEKWSIPMVAIIDGHVVASLRIIPNIPGVGLPINNESRPKIGQSPMDSSVYVFPFFQKEADTAPFEISQFAKTKDAQYRRDKRVVPAILRSYFQLAKEMGLTRGVAVIDSGVRETLNGTGTGFGLEAIGDTKMYMGSESTPIRIDVLQAIENCKNTSDIQRKALAAFLDGEQVPGYEWYCGR